MDLLSNRFEKLKENIILCRKCGLRDGAKDVIFGDGKWNAKIFWVGEAPGANEDDAGIPFVGSSGKLLRGFIETHPLNLYTHFITNVVKCRPPDNRNPKQIEIKSCFPHLVKQLEFIKPKIIITLGNFSLKALTGCEMSITRCHGQLMMYKNIPLMPLYHPAYMLYKQSSKSEFQKDIVSLIKKLEIITREPEKVNKNEMIK